MPLRPPNPPKITLDDLLPGDILLSAGSDWLDKLILLVDQGSYTHTTQYIGKNANGDHMVVEATEKGIKYQSITEDLTQDLVDAYRYESPNGHHFGDANWPVQPVLNEAISYQDAKYAYSELLMGAVVILTSEIPDEKDLSEIVRIALTYVEHQFEKWLTDNADKTPMTCVQVATSAHWQANATPINKYGLQVNINGARKSPFASKNLEAYQKLRTSLLNKISITHPEFSKKLKTKSGLVVFAGSDILPLGSCTPRDMETSPTLKFIGCIQDNRSY
tara:strand:- start:495 stop:1322 length:828 start_codon:yes stop_codon:yes gene_type:complete